MSKKDLLQLLFLDFPFDNKIVTVGYNADPGQQHINIINQLSKYEWKNCIFIFPLTYPKNTDYVNEIESLLKSTRLSYFILDKFLLCDQIAALRLVSNVFIQLQISDCLSASTQEHLYAGSRVITGKWLPYTTLVKAGVQFTSISSLGELVDCLNQIIEDDNQELVINNRKAIAALSSWNSVIDEWIRMVNFSKN